MPEEPEPTIDPLNDKVPPHLKRECCADSDCELCSGSGGYCPLCDCQFAECEFKEPELDDEIITCWCGAKGTYDELFEEPDGGNCYGTGELDCHCGGDLCVCHNHGTVECPGCPDCEDDDGTWDGMDDDDYPD